MARNNSFYSREQIRSTQNVVVVLNIHVFYCSAQVKMFNTRCVQMIGQCFQDLKDLSVGGKHIDLAALAFVG